MQNKKLRAAIVGAGYIASYHIEAISRDRDAQLVAICDLRRPAAEALVSGDASVKVYARYDEMLSAENPDVVHVLTQPDSHFELTRSALEAGCHVILEKPATTSSVEAREIARLASQSSLQVAINHNFIFSRPFLKLISAINNGDLGPLKSVRIVWKKPLPQIVSGPWHLWMLRSPVNVLFETGSHSVSELLSVMGEPPKFLNVYPRRPKK